VTARAFDGAGIGRELTPPATTSSDGSFSLNLGDYRGTVLLSVSGNDSATYRDLATGQEVPISDRVIYRALVDAPTDSRVAITPLTEMATYGALMNDAMPTAIEMAATVVSESLLDPSVDLIHTIPADLSGPEGSSPAETYAATIAALSAMTTQDDTLPDIHAVTALYEHEMFPDPGIVYAASTDYQGKFSLLSLVEAGAWSTLGTGLRQPAAINPSGRSAATTANMIQFDPIPVDQGAYAGPDQGWTGAISDKGWVTDTTAYYTTTDQPCSTSDLGHLVWAYESAMSNLFSTWGITASDLGVEPGNRLDVMCTNQLGSGMGDSSGFRVAGYDLATAKRSPSDYYQLVKHELVHTIQGNLIAPTHTSPTHWWFAEGLATWLAGPDEMVASNEALANWESRVFPSQAPPLQNPISVTIPGDTPAAGFNPKTHTPWVVLEGYYPQFGRAVEYLMTPAPMGAGNTLDDVKAMYSLMGNGTSFTEAFDSTMNITEADFEARFDQIMAGFLR